MPSVCSIVTALSYQACVRIASIVLLTASMAVGQILEIHTDSLTTYLPSGGTAIQGVRPRAEQRGTLIEGSRKGGSAFGWYLSANPFCGELLDERWFANVDLAAGTYSPTSVDIALPAPGFSWLIGRTYNARQQAGSDSNGYQGYNWFQFSQPELIRVEGSTDDKDVIYLVYGADRFAEFKRTTTTSSEYRGVNGAAGLIQHVAAAGGVPTLYCYYDQRGTKSTFFGDDTSDHDGDWQLWKIEDPAGNVAYVGHETDAELAVDDGYTDDGFIAKAYDTAGREYTYTYSSSTIGGTKRLTSVEVETPGGLKVARVRYNYYEAAESDKGNIGDLKLVSTDIPLSDWTSSSSWSTDGTKFFTRKVHYRYWTSGSGNPGWSHALKYVIGSEEYRRGDFAIDGVFDDDPLVFDDTYIKSLVSLGMEYDSERRVSKLWETGKCGCNGASDGVSEVQYLNSAGSFTSSYDTNWKNRVTITLPDDTYLVRYFDEAGQPLSSLLADADPDDITSDSGNPVMYWSTRVVRNSTGIITEMANPSNANGYSYTTTGEPLTAHSSRGLIRSKTLMENADDAQLVGLPKARWHKEGTSGTAYYENSSAYTKASLTVGATTIYRPFMASQRDYHGLQTSGTSTSHLTTFTYDAFHTGGAALMPKTITTSYPVVGTSENGPGTADTGVQYLRADGTIAFSKGSDGVLTYTEYDGGLISRMIVDADTSETGDFADAPSVWSLTGDSDALHLVTDYIFDPQGRPDTVILPDGVEIKFYYTRLADHRIVTLVIPNVTGTGTLTYHGPAEYTVKNFADSVEASALLDITGGSTTHALTSWIDEAVQSPIAAVNLVDTLTSGGQPAAKFMHLKSNTTELAGGRTTSVITYHNPPTDGGDGSPGTNYEVTATPKYDSLGRMVGNTSNLGTITHVDYDSRGRVVATWIGTNSYGLGWPDSSPSGTADMVKIEEIEYDDIQTGKIGGDGRVLKETKFVQDSTTDQRITEYKYDYRGRLKVQVNPQSPHVLYGYDNLGRLEHTAYYSSASGLSATDSPLTEDTDKIGLTENLYDAQGRVYRSNTYDNDAEDGDAISTWQWYDRAGRQIKSLGSSITKRMYDRLGQRTRAFLIAKVDDATSGSSSWTDAATVTGDIVLEETQTAYDDLTGRRLMETIIRRNHDDRSTGQTTGPLDLNTDNDLNKITASDLKGRPHITSFFYDDFARQVDIVNIGTNGGSDYDRSTASIPSRSNADYQVTTRYFNLDGTVSKVTDPAGTDRHLSYDGLGRKTAVRAEIAGDDAVTRYGYEDGKLKYIWTDTQNDDTDGKAPVSANRQSPADDADQVTEYIYGVVKGTSAGDSKIASGELLSQLKFPDSTGGSDVIQYAYNAQGERIWVKDQAGNIIQLLHDLSGREIHRTVAPAAGFDASVRRISTVFDDFGRVTTVTQYNNETPGSGTILDQVKYTYDIFNLLTKFEQDLDGPVGATNGDYEVGYEYALSLYSNGWQTIRPTSQVLRYNETDLETVSYTYISSNGRFDNAVSRPSQVKVGSTVVAAYEYSGAGQVVGVSYPEISVMSNRFGSTAGTYPAFDRLNRLVQDRWTKDLSTDIDFYSVDLSYDQNSNITWSEDNVFPGRDVKYIVDQLDRITDAQEGTRSGGSIISQARRETWTLSFPSNWTNRLLDLNGDGDTLDAGEFADDATFTLANEYSTRDTNGDTNVDLNYQGQSSASPAYDANGNLIDDQELYQFVYDGFNRLRFIKERASPYDVVAEYRYNGLGRRIAWHYDVDADMDVDTDDPWFYFVYDPQWRMVATFRSDDEEAKELFVNHAAPLGVDAVILRDKDANNSGGWADEADGTREERTYYCQNYRGDVVTLLGTAGGGHVREHVRYSSYGVPFGIPAGDLDGDGDADNDDGDGILDQQINGPYTVRADLDLDGTIDGGDVMIALDSITNGLTLGRGYLSSFGNRKGYAGYEHDGAINKLCHVRRRVYLADLGRWTARDPLGYADSMNMYQYGLSRPTITTDPSGLLCDEINPHCPLRIVCPDCELNGVGGIVGIDGGGGGGGGTSSSGNGRIDGGTWGTGGGGGGGGGGGEGGSGGGGPGSDGCEFKSDHCISYTRNRALPPFHEGISSGAGVFMRVSARASMSVSYRICPTVCKGCKRGRTMSIAISADGELEVKAGFGFAIPASFQRFGITAELGIGLFARGEGSATARRRSTSCEGETDHPTSICLDLNGRGGGFAGGELSIDTWLYQGKVQVMGEVAANVPAKVCWEFFGDTVKLRRVSVGVVTANVSLSVALGFWNYNGNFDISLDGMPAGIGEWLNGWERTW